MFFTLVVICHPPDLGAERLGLGDAARGTLSVGGLLRGRLLRPQPQDSGRGSMEDVPKESGAERSGRAISVRVREMGREGTFSCKAGRAALHKSVFEVLRGSTRR